MDYESKPSHYPFKFKQTWLGEQEFFQIVENFWSTYAELQISSPMQHFVKKLNLLWGEVIKWEILKKKSNIKELVETKRKLEELDNLINDHLFSPYKK